MLSGCAKVISRILFILLAILIVSTSCAKKKYIVVPQKEGETHLIKQGETLEEIAQLYYGDPSLARALAEYNHLDPLQPLKPGNTLLVPFDKKEIEKIKFSQDAVVMYNRGTVLTTTGDYEEAAKCLEIATEKDPSFTDAWYNLALVYIKLQRLDNALQILRNLATNYSKEKTYHYSLGVVWREMGLLEEALKEFRAALSIDHNYKEAQFATAMTLQEIGRYDEAVEAWEKYLELDGDSVWADEARANIERIRSR